MRKWPFMIAILYNCHSEVAAATEEPAFVARYEWLRSYTTARYVPYSFSTAPEQSCLVMNSRRGTSHILPWARTLVIANLCRHDANSRFFGRHGDLRMTVLNESHFLTAGFSRRHKTPPAPEGDVQGVS